MSNDVPPTSPSELSFTLTQVIREYMERMPFGITKAAFVGILGALEDVKDTVKRECVWPVEDTRRRSFPPMSNLMASDYDDEDV